jgi:hypothetical protein
MRGFLLTRIKGLSSWGKVKTKGLAFRAVSIAAGVIGRALKATGITLLEVAAQGRGAAALHRLQDLKMRDRQRMVAAIGLAIGAKDIGQLNAASSRCRLPRAGPHGLDRR